MTPSTLKKYFTKDNYLTIAYKHYELFKETSNYDEHYKKEILAELNEVFRNEVITEQNVTERARTIQQANPSSGSFVHWSNIDDLVKYAEARPAEAAEVWNQLYDATIPIKERIKEFRDKGKAFDSKISMGAPLFGYLLAAYAYEMYPLYKEEMFQKVKKTYGMERKLGTVGENYAFYLDVCEAVLKLLSKDHPNLNMLDVQDFFYCSTRYHKIIVESGVAFVCGLSQTLHEYMKDPASMLEEMNGFELSHLKELRDVYRGTEKVNKIKFLLLDGIIENNGAAMDDLEQLKEKISKDYDTNILHSFTNFTIMFPLVYYDKKQKVQTELTKIHRVIREIDEFKQFEFVADKTINGFSWNQGFGTSQSWIAVYESNYASHRSAPQLFSSFSEKGIAFGLKYGDDHPNSGMDDLEFISDMEAFTYEEFRGKFIEVFFGLKEDVKGSSGREYDTEDFFTTDEWKELFLDRDIFHESNINYLYHMLDMGGEATQVEMGEKLGRHPKSFNAAIVHLAKRIHKQTGVEIPVIYEEPEYWNILFNGEKTGSGHFRWMMKTNLKEALHDLAGTLQPLQEDYFTVEEWLEMLTNDAIIRERDREYLFKMHELGGGATGTELGRIFDRTHSAVNAVVGNMAKRVHEKTGVDVPVADGQTLRYWRLLFHGSREDDAGHFKWTMKENLHAAVATLYQEAITPYTKADFLREVFVDEKTYDTLADLLDYKKNIILQGPPGVGKTFVAKRLAKSLVRTESESRIEMVQFHQTYAYEDFVMGYRPDEGGFSLQTGIFYHFCKRAMDNPEQDYFFVIDEINRGNLSKIFGELFMLIERDKRDEYVSLGYSGEKFTVPQNVYLIGTMNTADRSLAQLEVALRRRFAFFTLEPAFNEKWKEHMRANGMSDHMLDQILDTVGKINDDIRADYQLGPGYEIGHSFFTTIPEGMAEEVWYERIIRFEITPLLEEYFYDRPEKVRTLIEGV